MSNSIDRLRKFLIGILILGLAATGVELLLLGHTEGIWQKVPLFLITLGLGVLIIHGFVRKSASVRAFQVTMILMVIGGMAGLFLHYDGNMEFELEMYPSLSGVKLFRETMTGATPVLAPGYLIQLGLLGLASTYRHPLLIASK